MAVFHYATGKTFWTKVLGDPVPNYNRDGFEWTFEFTPDAEGLALFQQLGIANKMKEKDGRSYLKFTQKQKQANGKDNFPITVVDARNRPWDPNVKIGNDSTVEVKFKVVDYGKGKPTGVYPQALRVLELKEYVRQEFAPLPEDSEYVQNFADSDFTAPVDEDGAVISDGDIVDDPLAA